MLLCLVFGKGVRKECRQLFAVARDQMLVEDICGNIFDLRPLILGKQVTQLALANLGEDEHGDDKNQENNIKR